MSKYIMKMFVRGKPASESALPKRILDSVFDYMYENGLTKFRSVVGGSLYEIAYEPGEKLDPINDKVAEILAGR